MEYFQFDALKEIARFVTENTWTRDDPYLIREKTGFEFAGPETHSPWRNYLRVFKLCLLVSEKSGVAIPTSISQMLSQDGAVTCDEYMHFLIEATTDPSPALSGWRNAAQIAKVRHPLCFSIKYLLTSVFEFNRFNVPINEVIGAYQSHDFDGSEAQSAYKDLLLRHDSYSRIMQGNTSRQARESIKFIAQISYLHNAGSDICVSLSREDARELFLSIHPKQGPFLLNGNEEIQRLAKLFSNRPSQDIFDYKKGSISYAVESGFSEGTKVKRTHIVVERNPKLREIFFAKRPTSICDACEMNTKAKYPWTNQVLDLHHILPLASGTRVRSIGGTVLDDLVAICPTCHRAVHKFYDKHLHSVGRSDFLNKSEALSIYARAKREIVKVVNSA